MSDQRFRVGISEYHVATAPSALVTYGLGSCLGIALYSAEHRIGGLAHTLLPKALPGIPGQRKGKFVDEAIDMMIAELNDLGAPNGSLTAKLVGGATMFEPLHGSEKDPIGVRNAHAARAALRSLDIPIVAEDIGGSHGRTMEFRLDSGIVLIKSVRGRNQALEL